MSFTQRLSGVRNISTVISGTSKEKCRNGVWRFKDGLIRNWIDDWLWRSFVSAMRWRWSQLNPIEGHKPWIKLYVNTLSKKQQYISYLALARIYNEIQSWNKPHSEFGLLTIYFLPLWGKFIKRGESVFVVITWFFHVQSCGNGKIYKFLSRHKLLQLVIHVWLKNHLFALKVHNGQAFYANVVRSWLPI